tara:strand:+ start:1064 stop:2065 length:1002 start_codon:yes stop_codon:yes gene_type:complete
MYQEKNNILPVTRILKTYVELQAIRTNILLLFNILLYSRNLSKDCDRLRRRRDSEIDLKSYFIYELIKNQNSIDTFCQYKLDINKKKLLDKYCTSLQIYHNVFLIFESYFEQNGPVVKNNLNQNRPFAASRGPIGTQTSNDFIDISTLHGIKLSSILKNYKKIYIGQKSTISIHNITKNQKKIIEESIKYNICNKRIVKKISSQSSSAARNEREIRILKALYKKTHFPVILSTKDNSLIMSYCGTKINNHNIPSDWKIQINEIINSLNSANIRKNNMWKNNFLVHNSILYIINFTSSSDKIEFPYQNISESDIEYFDNFIQLLGAVYRRSIKL